MTKKILFLAKFGGFSLTITDFILLRTFHFYYKMIEDFYLSIEYFCDTTNLEQFSSEIQLDYSILSSFAHENESFFIWFDKEFGD